MFIGLLCPSTTFKATGTARRSPMQTNIKLLSCLALIGYELGCAIRKNVQDARQEYHPLLPGNDESGDEKAIQ
jgi:hypothetical protein